MKWLVSIVFFILLACNSASDNTAVADSAILTPQDTNYPFPFNNKGPGADTDNHNVGNVPTNNVDVKSYPVILPDSSKR